MRDRLKLGGKFLAHELLARHQEAQIHQTLARVIRVNSTPLSQAKWIAACEAADLEVQQHQTGPMEVLNLGQIIRDQGIMDTVRILWKGLIRDTCKQRATAPYKP